MLECTEDAPTECMEPTSFKHWQRVSAPHKHEQLVATKACVDEKYNLATRYRTAYAG